jgi:ABC-type nitrate/sulfonate/bicarbonate transport system substrate-binding protein
LRRKKRIGEHEMMTRRFSLQYSILSLVFLTVVWLGAQPARGAETQLKRPVSGTKIRLAVASPSLSYLPIYVALQKGFFARRGFDMEVIQMAAGLTAPALLNRAIDYTTVPSGVATAGARGAPLKVICLPQSSSSICSSAGRK